MSFLTQKHISLNKYRLKIEKNFTWIENILNQYPAVSLVPAQNTVQSHS